MKKLLIFSLVILLVGCKQSDLGDYVYIDLMDVLHVKQDCKAVARDHNAQPVEPVPLSKVTDGMLDDICSRCVGHEAYAALRALINTRNNGDSSTESPDSTVKDSDSTLWEPDSVATN